MISYILIWNFHVEHACKKKKKRKGKATLNKRRSLKDKQKYRVKIFLPSIFISHFTRSLKFHSLMQFEMQVLLFGHSCLFLDLKLRISMSTWAHSDTQYREKPSSRLFLTSLLVDRTKLDCSFHVRFTFHSF